MFGAARVSDPQTSKRAAKSVRAGSLAERVLAELRAGGPGTTHELAERMDLSLVTVSPRMRPLEAAGQVERAGEWAGRTIWRAL